MVGRFQQALCSFKIDFFNEVKEASNQKWWACEKPYENLPFCKLNISQQNKTREEDILFDVITLP